MFQKSYNRKFFTGAVQSVAKNSMTSGLTVLLLASKSTLTIGIEKGGDLIRSLRTDGRACVARKKRHAETEGYGNNPSLGQRSQTRQLPVGDGSSSSTTYHMFGLLQTDVR